jgi:S-DNA-T family DNA segregation ATPase FtsK/SpoIIIE
VSVTEDRRDQDGEPGDELVPAAASDVEHVGQVVDAEIVDDDQPRQAVARVVAVARQVRQHKPTVAVTRVLVRQLIYLVAGSRILTARLWDAKTNARPERLMRAAEAAGDWDHLGEWHDRGEQMRDSRHKRHMDFLELPLRAAKAVGISILALHVLLLFVGFALWASDEVANMLAPLLGLYAGIAWVAHAVSVAWSILWRFGLMVLVSGIWLIGKKHAVPGQFARPQEAEPGDVMDGLPDERMITQALRKTLPALDRAIKEGWNLHYLVPPMPDGKGWVVEIALPQAAPVEDFVRNKTDLAHNLRRYPNEVWLSEPQAAVLRLWVAKPGALSGPVDPWPLLKNLDSAKSDYFKGVPVGVTIKGDVIKGRLSEANWVGGGMMGSGKSTLVITALAGAMLDPLVDIDVVVMAQNADYEPMEPRLNRLVTGVGEETVEQCMAMLYELFDDLTIRGKALKEHDERAVTREIAEKDARLRPRIMVIDECQNLFISDHGKDAIEITTKVMSTARKYGITLMFLTPEPSKDALPRKLISVASNKACFAIGDHQANDAVLGSGSYKSGISAVGLTPKTDEGAGDVGTCMQRGFTGKPGLMRGFYIAQGDVHRVTQRALQLRNGRQLLAPAAVREKRDLLADVGEVIGQETVPAADIPALLSRAFPSQVLYRQLTGKQLRQLLKDEYGVKVPTTDNRFPVSPKLIGDALDGRED